MKKGHRTVFQNAWSQKDQHSHWKNKSASKKLINSYEKRHRTVFQNAWSQKDQHSPWKNNSVSKKLKNSYEKRAQKRLPKCLKPKKPTLSLKKQFCFKKAYKFIWKKGTEPSSKMPEAKKQTLSLQKQFCFNFFKFVWKRATEPSSKMPEAKKTNTHWKNNSVSKKLIISYEKRAQNRLPKCLKPKKQTLSLKKTILFQKSFQIHMKKGHRTVFQNAWSQKNQHSLWKSHTVSKRRIEYSVPRLHRISNF